MNLTKATELKVGDRVVFKPVTKLDDYVFSSSFISGQSETLFSGQEYFISTINYLDKDGHSLAYNYLFDDWIDHKVKQKTADVLIKLNGLGDEIVYDNFQKPKNYSNDYLDQAILFGKKLSCETLTAQEILATLNFTDNIGDMSLDNYLEYLNFAKGIYQKPISFLEYERWDVDVPSGSTISDMYEAFCDLLIARSDRYALDAEFVKFMQTVGFKNYYSMMLALQEGHVSDDKLITFFDSEILRNEDWIISACYGSSLFQEKISEEWGPFEDGS